MGTLPNTGLLKTGFEGPRRPLESPKLLKVLSKSLRSLSMSLGSALFLGSLDVLGSSRIVLGLAFGFVFDDVTGVLSDDDDDEVLSWSLFTFLLAPVPMLQTAAHKS